MKVKGDVKLLVKPLGGQIIPFTLIIIAAALFFTSVWLDMTGKSYTLAAVGAGLCFLAGVGLYLLSRRDSDLQKAHAFGMTMGSGATKVAISSDSRSLPALDYLKGILSHWACLLEREPLPEASGTIDEHGNPVPNSEGIARDITKKANDIAAAQIDSVAKQVQASSVAGHRQSPVIDDSEPI